MDMGLPHLGQGVLLCQGHIEAAGEGKCSRQRWLRSWHGSAQAKDCNPTGPSITHITCTRGDQAAAFQSALLGQISLGL